MTRQLESDALALNAMFRGGLCVWVGHWSTRYPWLMSWVTSREPGNGRRQASCIAATSAAAAADAAAAAAAPAAPLPPSRGLYFMLQIYCSSTGRRRCKRNVRYRYIHLRLSNSNYWYQTRLNCCSRITTVYVVHRFIRSSRPCVNSLIHSHIASLCYSTIDLVPGSVNLLRAVAALWRGADNRASHCTL